MYAFYLISILLLIFAWVILNPLDTLKIIEVIRRQFRQFLIHRYGNQATKELAQRLRTEAWRMNIPTAVADELILENKQEITERLGNKIVRNLLDD